MKKILILGAQHGNELLGHQLYQHVSSRRPDLLDYVTFRVANLRAYKFGVRFIESDMNRSYGYAGNTYERRRASKILSYMNTSSFDLVLDCHTTTCVQPPCVIVAPKSSTAVKFAEASSIKHIVHMSDAIAKHSLIGACPQAVSVEISCRDVNERLLAALSDDINRYIHDTSSNTSSVHYDVSSYLKKGELPKGAVESLRNFKKSEYGFYPILVGEEAYEKQKSYLGFKGVKSQKVGYNEIND